MLASAAPWNSHSCKQGGSAGGTRPPGNADRAVGPWTRRPGHAGEALRRHDCDLTGAPQVLQDLAPSGRQPAHLGRHHLFQWNLAWSSSRCACRISSTRPGRYSMAPSTRNEHLRQGLFSRRWCRTTSSGAMSAGGRGDSPPLKAGVWSSGALTACRSLTRGFAAIVSSVADDRPENMDALRQVGFEAT